MFARILVGVDGSKGAEAALRRAAELAQLCGAELFVLSVFRHHSLREASISMVRPREPENMDDLLRTYAQEVAEQARRIARETGVAKVRAFVRSGQPARTIVVFGDEHEADLIVVGSRGLGAIKGYLVGSVSHKITGLAGCPVLVV